jgi:hypothetical protein
MADAASKAVGVIASYLRTIGYSYTGSVLNNITAIENAADPSVLVDVAQFVADGRRDLDATLAVLNANAVNPAGALRGGPVARTFHELQVQVQAIQDLARREVLAIYGRKQLTAEVLAQAQQLSKGANEHMNGAKNNLRDVVTVFSVCNILQGSGARGAGAAAAAGAEEAKFGDVNPRDDVEDARRRDRSSSRGRGRSVGRSVGVSVDSKPAFKRGRAGDDVVKAEDQVPMKADRKRVALTPHVYPSIVDVDADVDEEAPLNPKPEPRPRGSGQTAASEVIDLLDSDDDADADADGADVVTVLGDSPRKLQRRLKRQKQSAAARLRNGAGARTAEQVVKPEPAYTDDGLWMPPAAHSRHYDESGPGVWNDPAFVEDDVGPEPATLRFPGSAHSRHYDESGPGVWNDPAFVEDDVGPEPATLQFPGLRQRLGMYFVGVHAPKVLSAANAAAARGLSEDEVVRAAVMALPIAMRAHAMEFANIPVSGRAQVGRARARPTNNREDRRRVEGILAAGIPAAQRNAATNTRMLVAGLKALNAGEDDDGVLAAAIDTLPPAAQAAVHAAGKPGRR